MRGAALVFAAGCAGNGPKTPGSSEPLVVGSAAACLYGEGMATEAGLWDITGAVVSDEAGALTQGACDGSVSRVLTIAGNDGVTWSLGYGLQDASGADLTPALDVEPGGSIYLRFRAASSFATATGFALQDTESLIAALESRAPVLEAADAGGLAVVQGDVADYGADDCGDQTGYTLIFEGDADLEMTPVEDRLITLNAHALHAYALSSWAYSAQTCEDAGGVSAWAAFR